MLLGRIYYRQERYTEAVAEYNQALISQPGYYFAHCNRGYAYRRMGLPDQAITEFKLCSSLAEDKGEGWRQHFDKLILEIEQLGK